MEKSLPSPSLERVARRPGVVENPVRKQIGLLRK